MSMVNRSSRCDAMIAAVSIRSRLHCAIDPECRAEWYLSISDRVLPSLVYTNDKKH